MTKILKLSILQAILTLIYLAKHSIQVYLVKLKSKNFKLLLFKKSHNMPQITHIKNIISGSQYLETQKS